MAISEEKLGRIRELIGVQEGMSVDAPILRGRTIRQVATEIQQLLAPEPQPATKPRQRKNR